MSTIREMTAEQIAKSEGVTVDAVRARWNDLRETNSELFAVPFSRNVPLNFAQETALRSAKGSAKRSAKKPIAANTVSAQSKEVAPPVIPPVTVAEKATVNLSAIRRFAFDAVCILIVVGHAGLIWYDCYEMWEMPGMFGGGLSFLFVIGAVLIATDSTRQRTSGYALGFMFAVDIAAFFVHFPTFLKYAEIGEIQTGALCGFICLLSFAALYLYQDSKLD